MSKHTPGPWVVSDVDTVNPRIDGQDGRGIAHATQRDPHPVNGQGITIEQAMANALLIAAAPDLLDALMRLVADFEAEIHDSYDGTKYLEEKLAVCDYARYAIAKARGDQ